MNKKRLSIINNVDQLTLITDAVEEIAGEWGLSSRVSMNLNLVLEEIVSNIMFYGFKDENEHDIRIAFIKEANQLKVIITDDGEEFNILSTEDFKDEDKTAEEREIGGLGIHFVKTLVDHIDYQRENDMNILTLFKNINT